MNLIFWLFKVFCIWVIIFRFFSNFVVGKVLFSCSGFVFINFFVEFFCVFFLVVFLFFNVFVLFVILIGVNCLIFFFEVVVVMVVVGFIVIFFILCLDFSLVNYFMMK